MGGKIGYERCEDCGRALVYGNMMSYKLSTLKPSALRTFKRKYSGYLILVDISDTPFTNKLFCLNCIIKHNLITVKPKTQLNNHK